VATYLKLRSDIEVAVRDALTDPTDYSGTPDGTDARWNRETLLYWFNSGVKDVRRKRPEAKYNGRELIDFREFTVALHTADGLTLLEENLFNLIVNYICWRLLEQDNVDEHSARKAAQFQAAYYGGI